MTLYVKYTKNPAVEKWLAFDLICAVTIGVHYLGRPCVRFTLNGYIGHTSCQKVAYIGPYMCGNSEYIVTSISTAL